MAPADQDIQQKYDRAARTYDQLWQHYINATLDHVTDTLQLEGNEHVLDVSCGTGALIHRLRAHYSDLKITGLDLSEEMIAQARRKVGDHPGVTLQQGSAEDLPFDSETFNVVVSTSAFHYYGHPEQALAEFRRVLRPGGRLALLDWNADYWLWWLLDPLLRRLDAGYHGCYGPEGVNALLDEAGFQEIGVHTARAGWIWGVWMAFSRRPR